MIRQHKSAPSPDKAKRESKPDSTPAERKPKDETERQHPADMPGAAGFTSARADEDTYD